MYTKDNYIQDLIYFKDVILLPNSFIDEDKIKIKAINDNSVFAIYDNLIDSNNSYYYEIYNIINQSVDRVVIPDFAKQNTMIIKDFAISDKILSILFTNSSCIIYKKDSTGGFVIDTVITDVKYDYVKIMNNSVILYSYNIYNGTKVIKFDINNNYLRKEHIFDNPIGIEFTLFQPKQLIDISNNFIAISELNTMKINLYDWNFNKVDSINFEVKDWVNNEKATDYFSVYKNNKIVNAKGTIEELRPLLKEFSMIHKINFISEDKLLIFWSSPSNNSLYDFKFSLCTKDNGKWITTYDILLNKEIMENMVLEEYLKNWKITNNYFIENNNIYLIYAIPIEVKNSLKEMKILDLQKNIENYLLENENLRHSVLIFGFNK